MLSTQQAEWLVTFYRNLPGVNPVGDSCWEVRRQPFVPNLPGVNPVGDSCWEVRRQPFVPSLPGQTAFDQLEQPQQPQQFPELLQPESQEPFERYPAQS